ncbi:hybrid sensor histidine kinase/response regulator [Nitrospina watsonii]|uniref:histidine kinase n=1 Tax=Nitrospina watsonii TaxID=1323948 RepID=A0ABM9HAG8_9BACT|nr:hybrid sensor histidine kinase/response regulator [Nitrospina watsonii]CAI2717137.1 Chemotaxis regulator - transmits chemoreceptor signals to flagelllar motor components CheY [Nitrospina watsonii]
MNRTLSILLVEDDEEDAFFIKNMLSPSNTSLHCQISHLDGPVEALKVLETEHIDVCLFDYRLRDSNGIDLLRQVRAKGYSQPIVFLTGQSDPEVAAEAIKCGATDYRSKNNLTAESLTRCIEMAIQLQREADLRERAEEELKCANDKLLDANLELKNSLQKLQVAQESIIRSEKLASIGRLAAMVCHEVLNPLNIISSHVQTLMRHHSGDPTRDDHYKSMREEIFRIDKILSDLLRFSRKGNMEFQDVDFNEELDFVLSLLEKEMRMDCVQLERDFIQEEVVMKADPDRMRQVFLNLFNNARHAMPQGGVLTVRTKQVVREIWQNRRKEDVRIDPEKIPVRRENFFHIEVADTGSGIPQENMRKIFEPFFTTKPEEKGTGLGLSVCFTIVEQHGGFIEVESEENKGTSIHLWLPIKSCEENIVPVASAT